MDEPVRSREARARAETALVRVLWHLSGTTVRPIAAQTDGQVTAAELRADAIGAITAFLDALGASPSPAATPAASPSPR